MTNNKSNINFRNNNFCVVVIRDRGDDPALDEMWKGLRSLANAYIYRLRNVKSKRRKPPTETGPPIPAAPVVPIPPAALAPPVVPPVPIRPQPPPVSYVDKVKTPPKVGSLHVRRASPVPSSIPPKPLAPSSSLALSGKPGKIVISPPKPPRVKHLPLFVLKGCKRPMYEQAFNKNIYCFSCGELGKVRCNKWLPSSVNSGDEWAPGFHMSVEYHQGFCDNCWPFVGKPLLSGDLSGVVGEYRWVAEFRGSKKS